jgi:competence protein ComEA
MAAGARAMFNLTRQERLVLLFLAAALAVGAGVRVLWGRKAPPPPKPMEAEWDLTAPKATAAPTAFAETPAAARQIDPNVATAAELETLPGIGEVLAARVVSYRATHPPFRNPEDLARVEGISPALAGRLAPYLTFATPK